MPGSAAMKGVVNIFHHVGNSPLTNGSPNMPGGNGIEKKNKEQLDALGEIRKSTSQFAKDMGSQPRWWTKALKTMGVQMSLSGILKQSQVFTSTLGSLFQILGAFVDVILAPWIPVIIPVLRKFALQMPRVRQWAQNFKDWVVDDAWPWVQRKWKSFNENWKVFSDTVGSWDWWTSLPATFVDLLISKLKGLWNFVINMLPDKILGMEGGWKDKLRFKDRKGEPFVESDTGIRFGPTTDQQRKMRGYDLPSGLDKELPIGLMAILKGIGMLGDHGEPGTTNLNKEQIKNFNEQYELNKREEPSGGPSLGNWWENVRKNLLSSFQNDTMMGGGGSSSYLLNQRSGQSQIGYDTGMGTDLHRKQIAQTNIVEPLVEGFQKVMDGVTLSMNVSGLGHLASNNGKDNGTSRVWAATSGIHST